MSFTVSTYNTDSGWCLGSMYTAAANETEAVADAAKHWGVTGLQNFRHVAVRVDNAPDEKVVENATVIEPVPVKADPAETEAAAIFEDLGNVDHNVLAKVFAKLNSALGG